MVPFAFLNDQWIGYDDVQSVTIKSNYALDAGLGGVMVWSIETDDFRGNCGNGEYPLLTAINEVMRGDTVVPNPTTASTTGTTTTGTTTTGTTTTTTTTDQPTETSAETTISHQNDPTFDCSQDGTFRDPTNCSNFIVCNAGRMFPFECPPGLMFDLFISTCNWETDVVC